MFSFKPHLIIPNTRGIYLRRWFCTRWSDDNHQWKGRRLPNMYLHNMLDHDDDRALHDHPWDNLSIVLWGGYIEHVFAYPPEEGQPLPPVIQKRRRMGSIVYRPAHMAHRLELYQEPVGVLTAICNIAGANIQPTLRPCWTLFLTWRKTRDWGFWCEKAGTVGRSLHPLSTEVGAVNVVLTYSGKVAYWVHQKLFHEREGVA